MTITYQEIPDQNTVEFSIDGNITKEDYMLFADQFEKFIETHGPIKILEVVKNFNGIDISMIWEEIKFDIKHLQDISHCAVVSDIGWVSPFAKAAGSITSIKLQTFSLNQLDEAREWLKNS